MHKDSQHFTQFYSIVHTRTALVKPLHKTNLTTTLDKTILYALYTTLHNFTQLYTTSQKLHTTYQYTTSQHFTQQKTNFTTTFVQRYKTLQQLFFTNVYTTIHTFRTALQRLYTIVQQLYKLFILSHKFYKSLQSLTTSFYKPKYRTLQNVEQIYTFKHKTFQNLTTLHTNCTKMYKMFKTLQTVGNSAERHTQLYTTYTLKFTQHNFYNTSTK